LGCYRSLLSEEQAYVWGKGIEVKTPNIDRVAKEGAICLDYYASSPVCTPSRASFQTGLYPIAAGAPINGMPMDPNLTTFAEVLRQEGYQTSYVGKWHLAATGVSTFNVTIFMSL
jgi:arylsulfatase A-like enzyme